MSGAVGRSVDPEVGRAAVGESSKPAGRGTLERSREVLRIST